MTHRQHISVVGFYASPAPKISDKNERHLAYSHFLVNNTHSPQGRNHRRGEAEGTSDTMYETLAMAVNQTYSAPGLG